MIPFSHLYQQYRHHSPVFFYWIAGIIGSFLSGVASMLTVKLLSLEDFANISFYLSVQSIILILLNPLTGTAIRFAGELNYAQDSKKKWRRIFRLGIWNLIGGGITTVLFILSAPWWTAFFNFPTDPWTIGIAISFFPLFFIFSWMQAILTALQYYKILGWQNIQLALIKYLFLGLAVIISYKFLSVLISFPIGILGGIVLFGKPLFRLLKPHFNGFGKSYVRISKPMIWFFLNSIILNLGNIGLLNLDVLLAKHYLSSVDAGIYATLNVIGKMLLLINGSYIGLLTPLLAARLDKPLSMRRVLIMIISLTVVTSGLGMGVLWLFPTYTLEFLLKDKAALIQPFLLPYLLAVTNLCILFSFTSYQLVKTKYWYSFLVIGCMVLEGLIIGAAHKGIGQIVYALLIASSLAMGVVILMKLNLSELALKISKISDFNHSVKRF